MRKIQLNVSVAALIAVLLIGAPMRAQVTIGANIDPNAGSLLDLKTSDESVNATKGLLLPRVMLTDLNKLYPMFTGSYDSAENAAHVGLTVYNIPAPAEEGGCYPDPVILGGIYVWDGTRWNDIYVATKYVDITVNEPATNGTRTLRFLTYNLGANPDMTPKEQMAYTSTGADDITVFGGLYQWGRKDAEHSLRCANDAGHSGSFTETLYTSALSDDYYDPAVSHKFVWGSAVSGNSYDWLSPHKDASDLWGDGGGLSTQADTPYPAGANNPCPSGYRVPTQYEWALLGNEGGNSRDTSNDNFGSIPASGKSGSSGIVWVPVSGGYAKNDDWTGDGAVRGYALYNSSDWTGAADEYKDGIWLLSDAAAPEPLLFLPAGGVRYDSDSLVGDTGSYGSYWSSVVSDSAGSYVFFDSRSVIAFSAYHRAFGMSVRCVAE